MPGEQDRHRITAGRPVRVGRVMMLKRLLAHPLTKDMDIDSPQTTLLRRRIIREKPFLRKTYEHWYRRIVTALPDGDGLVVELGSGGGFMSEFIPNLITSDVFEVPGVKTVVDAHALPFADGSLRAIVMTDVLHHIPDVRRFLTEATRCVRVGGAIVMIEPWVTPWAQLVWRFHHEAFAPQAPTWSIPHGGSPALSRNFRRMPARSLDIPSLYRTAPVGGPDAAKPYHRGR